ncbi:Os10g0345200, partial [Oryza sativa Japonica Group]
VSLHHNRGGRYWISDGFDESCQKVPYDMWSPREAELHYSEGPHRSGPS